VDRVTGSLVRLSVDAPYDASTAGAGQFFNFAPAADGAQGAAPAAIPFPGSTVEPGAAPLAAERPLRENALDLWATLVQSKYNASGKLSDNRLVMNKRDIPQGVVCDVAAASNGYWPKRYEEWRLVCSRDNFRSSIVIQVNGTAARGLTGGSFYALENPFTVYGTGLWPDNAYDTLPAPESTPDAGPAEGEATPQGGPVLQETPNPARIHTVRPGESLAVIAKRYAVPVARLVAANEIQYPQLQANPNVIVVGWELSIPE
jgi:LysM repeat protein